MSLTMRWVGEADYDLVAATRTLCYGAAPKDQSYYANLLRADPRAGPGDFLLAEDATVPIGTATAFSMTTWVRGSPLPCQGVGYVGTIRTHRRGKGSTGEKSIASALMRETLRTARERGQVISALMPFRASFYEHFGYGIVERLCEWTIPLSVLPTGPFDSLRFAKPTDRPAIAAAYQRSVECGQCNMERSPARWNHIWRTADEGFDVIDRPSDDGPVQGRLYYNQFTRDTKDILSVTSHFTDSPAAFRRQLHFLASLRDQYHAVTIILPADLPLNWLLAERQLPHRLVNHPTASMHPMTRMQMRVLDHVKLLEAMHLPQLPRGVVVVAVHETEGQISRFKIDLCDGRAIVKMTDSAADLECSDVVWAAIALGELPIEHAAGIGLVDVRNPSKTALLEIFARGPAPFCLEYF